VSEHGRDRESCLRLLDRLSDFIEGELSPDLRAEMEGHMGDCEPCVRFVESLRRTVSLVETQETPPLPSEARREVLAALERVRREKGS
jgi:anti-sigma factor RsiW